MQGYCTNTEYTGSLGYNSVCYITSRIRWVFKEKSEQMYPVKGGKKRLGGIKGCCCCFSHSAYWLPTRKTTLHDSQSRSWSAGQGKKKREKSGSTPPPPPPPPLRVLLVPIKKKKKKKSRNASTCLGATQVSVHLASAQEFLRLVG